MLLLLMLSQPAVLSDSQLCGLSNPLPLMLLHLFAILLKLTRFHHNLHLPMRSVTESLTSHRLIQVTLHIQFSIHSQLTPHKLPIHIQPYQLQIPTLTLIMGQLLFITDSPAIQLLKDEHPDLLHLMHCKTNKHYKHVKL